MRIREAATEEIWWAKVAASMGMTLQQFDKDCGL